MVSVQSSRYGVSSYIIVFAIGYSNFEQRCERNAIGCPHHLGDKKLNRSVMTSSDGKRHRLYTVCVGYNGSRNRQGQSRWQPLKIAFYDVRVEVISPTDESKQVFGKNKARSIPRSMVDLALERPYQKFDEKHPPFPWTVRRAFFLIAITKSKSQE